jgi:hypothetical protein
MSILNIISLWNALLVAFTESANVMQDILKI